MNEKVKINNIPLIVWGEKSEKVFLYVHGQGGNKEEAEGFSKVAKEKGFQVLSIDLPGHGERKSEIENFNPWSVVPELTSIMEYAKSNWKSISLFAGSIGAYFSMLAFKNENLLQSLFVSPIVDMEYLIKRMMTWANVTESKLEKEKIIPTNFGQTLSWKYLQWIKNHPIEKWNCKTSVLYGEHDNLMEQCVVKSFCKKNDCDFTMMKNGEHWFHTEEEVAFMNEWMTRKIR